MARAVTHLPDSEQLGQPATMACAQRRGDGEERVREGTRDLVLVQVARDRVDVAAVRLKPVVIVRRDAQAEHVYLPAARRGSRP